MSLSHGRFGLVGVLILAVLMQTAATAMTSEEAVELMAMRLDQNQIKEGPDAGLWPLEMAFLGPITTGMASAYEWTGDPAYRQAAELAGEWVLTTAIAQGSLFGDEAYAFVWLSETADDPSHNMWQNALVDFYLSPRKQHNEDTTEEYLAAFDGLEPSTAVFYLAHHLVAADYVEDQDVDVYRQTLLAHLSRVDDEAVFPVMALGIATWALVTTDSLAETPIVANPMQLHSPLWDGLAVGDMPGLLASHQVPEGELFAGSFYWRFDHTDAGTGGVVSGYTEDTIFGTLGLVAAASQRRAEADEEMDQAIQAAQAALLHGVDENGQVYEHLTCQGATRDTFAGEMLQVLWSVEQYLNPDVAVEEPEAPADSDPAAVVPNT